MSAACDIPGPVSSHGHQREPLPHTEDQKATRDGIAVGTHHNEREGCSDQKEVEPEQGAADHVGSWPGLLVKKLGGQNSCYTSWRKKWQES